MNKKVLVVCYSRTGTTLQVGRDLAIALGADFEQIEDPCDRKGAFGFLRSSLEALARGLPSIRTSVDPASYDLVVLGTPVWAGSISGPMRAYLFRHAPRLRRVALFATMRAAGADPVFQEMRSLCGVDHAPCCALLQRDVRSGQYRQLLEEFVEGLERTSVAAEPLATAAA